MNVKVKYNENNPNLWCVECKEEIVIGDKFGTIKESYNGESYEKHYHCGCLPDEEEEIYIPEED